jgi:hypothetical protein
MIICHGIVLFWSSLVSWRLPVPEWA